MAPLLNETKAPGRKFGKTGRQPRLQRTGKTRSRLPTVMRKRLIGLCHTMRIFLFLDRASCLIIRIKEFRCQTTRHTPLAARARTSHQPPQTQGESPIRRHVDRNLIGRPADPARPHLQDRLDILHRLLKYLKRFLPRALLNDIKGIINNALGQALLPPLHNHIDTTGDKRIAIFRIRWHRTFLNHLSTWHALSPKKTRRQRHIPATASHRPPNYDFFAPYFDRPCLRFCTPIVSSVPRII